jgi:excisionase family DNA binding protein
MKGIARATQTSVPLSRGGCLKIYRTPAQEAERLQISLRTMREMIRRREFSTYRIGHKLLLVADEVDGTLDLPGNGLTANRNATPVALPNFNPKRKS